VTEPAIPRPTVPPNHYRLLGLHPSAGDQQIRRAYRDRSRLYHPDTTKLSAHIAKQKFQRLNEAYGILSSPERRRLYDQTIGYSRVTVAQPSQMPGRPPLTVTEKYERTSSAYLDATDRPLSSGELFALFMLGVTFLGCLVIAIVVGLSHPQSVIQPEFARELGLMSPIVIAAPPPNRSEEPVRLEEPHSELTAIIRPWKHSQPNCPPPIPPSTITHCR
jgi:curved DNA-binding protein CbpA